MDLALRLLDPTDAPAFQSLRLEGLLHHPASFRATYEEEAAQSSAEVAGRLREQAVFGAFVDGELCAIAGFARAAQAKKRHKGELWGVYVREGARREGLGSAVVGAVIEHARGEVAQLCATVALSNRPARRLYRKLGFERYGLEPRGLKVGERYLDQEHLVLLLDAGATRARIREAARSGLRSTGTLALCHDRAQVEARRCPEKAER
jgi:ribosomal protein S18 acetylase RimI-like enzyme